MFPPKSMCKYVVSSLAWIHTDAHEPTWVHIDVQVPCCYWRPKWFCCFDVYGQYCCWKPYWCEWPALPPEAMVMSGTMLPPRSMSWTMVLLWFLFVLMFVVHAHYWSSRTCLWPVLQSDSKLMYVVLSVLPVPVVLLQQKVMSVICSVTRNHVETHDLCPSSL